MTATTRNALSPMVLPNHFAGAAFQHPRHISDPTLNLGQDRAPFYPLEVDPMRPGTHPCRPRHYDHVTVP
jgi:hypothetical protein